MADKQAALDYHQKGRRGKIEVVATKPLNTQRDLSLAYTPGVAEACRAIYNNPHDVFKYTAKGNLVAVVTNGTAVLGLGNIGPEAGKPVMEGKANLFKKFADIDVFDIELNATTADEIVMVVKAMAPTFGGINLEDIKSPECFEVERRLQEELDIPVFHDDQHGTAIISAAALINALDITDRDIATAQFVFSGAGAAALACARLYVSLGALRENMVFFDSRGAITKSRTDLNSEKAEFAIDREVESLTAALVDADVFLGLSVGNVLTADMILPMAPRPILFAMANPDPEIPYDVAKAARPDAIIATGRSDHPNQVNNVLGFPFVFRGALDCRARKITEEMKVAATRAISELARADVPDSVLRAYGATQMQYGPDYIIPKPFDPRVLLYVAPAVAQAAADSGVAREPIEDLDGYREWLHRLVERSRGLMHPLIRRAKAAKNKPRIVFTDGASPQILRAVRILADEGICAPVLLGHITRIQALANDLAINLEGIGLQETTGGSHIDTLAEAYWKLRQRKGVTLRAAKALLNDPIYYGAMMVQTGLADGLVGGPDRPYKHTLRPALRILGTDSDSQAVSGVYALLAGDDKLFIGDCTVNVEPDAAKLAEIALNTARVAETFGQIPRVAMLSYSDFGEHHRDAEVRKVRHAVELVRARRPDLEVDGEMQADTAMDPEKRRQSFPFSTLTGAANTLIVPNLTAGNITYKLLEKVANTEVLGPLLVGLAKPVNVIPVGSSVENIVNIATYTATQVLDQAAKIST